MTSPIDDEGARRSGATGCRDCGAGLSPGQRYCLRCGARCGPLPAVVGDRVAALKERGRPTAARKPPAEAAAAAAASAGPAAEKDGYWRFMPTPQVAAVAVMALLAAGVVIGSVTSPLASSAGFAPIILRFTGGGGEEAPEPAPETTAVPAVPSAPALISEAPEAPVPLPESVPPAPESSPPPPKLPPELPEEPGLPEVKHVFLIVLEGDGYEATFGKASSAPFFSQTLAKQGELLSNYYAVTQGSLANQIALLSGQGPTPQTAAGCPEYAPIVPGTLNPEGQVEGNGCIYPKEAQTLPGQLVEKKLSWKAYVEGRTAPCTPEGARDPLVYFASLTESPECASRDVGLDQLDADLEQATKTPTLSYIVPDACHNGSEVPCAPEQPAGLAGAQAFLETVVPKLTASAAYKEGGLIAIAFAQAPQAGPVVDSSSCCGTPEYPNLPAPATPPAPVSGPVKPSGGGGRVGLLLISPFVKPGSVEESGYYNHFSLLRSVEELFELKPLGYAASEVLTPFESGSVYNAEESTASSTVRRPPASRRAPR